MFVDDYVRQQKASLDYFKNAVKNLQELNKELKEENARLREELAKKTSQATPSPSVPESAPKHEFPQVTTTTNFDILKRLNRLEKEVFGKQVVDRDF